MFRCLHVFSVDLLDEVAQMQWSRVRLEVLGGPSLRKGQASVLIASIGVLSANITRLHGTVTS